MVVIQTAHGDALPVAYQLPSREAVLAAAVSLDCETAVRPQLSLGTDAVWRLQQRHQHGGANRTDRRIWRSNFTAWCLWLSTSKAISAALSAFGASYGKGTSPRGAMSAAGRARIAAAQRTRWAKVKAKGENANVVAMPKKRTMSAAGRRKIAAAQRARWAKVKAAKKSA